MHWKQRHFRNVLGHMRPICSWRGYPCRRVISIKMPRSNFVRITLLRDVFAALSVCWVFLGWLITGWSLRTAFDSSWTINTLYYKINLNTWLKGLMKGNCLLKILANTWITMIKKLSKTSPKERKKKLLSI